MLFCLGEKGNCDSAIGGFAGELALTVGNVSELSGIECLFIFIAYKNLLKFTHKLIHVGISQRYNFESITVNACAWMMSGIARHQP